MRGDEVTIQFEKMCMCFDKADYCVDQPPCRWLYKGRDVNAIQLTKEQLKHPTSSRKLTMHVLLEQILKVESVPTKQITVILLSPETVSNVSI